MTDRDLDAWTAAEPPPGFVDRVMAARQLALEPPRWKTRLGLAISLAVAGLAAAAVPSLRSSAAPESGALLATSRQTLAIGRRAVAVAEAGSDLRYRVADGAVRVNLSRGDVFFRVDRGGPFVVATPAGDVEVKGTCFRVEVDEGVVVTVYEGKVLLANERGKLELAAGQTARAETGRAPAAGGPRRDAAQPAELAALPKALAERGPPAGVDAEEAMPSQGDSFFTPSRDELLEMARNCELRADSPDPESITPELAEKVGLTDAERQAAVLAYGAAAEHLRQQMRALYVEVTGNVDAPEDLGTVAMWQELQQKSLREDLSAAARVLSAERAGLSPPPVGQASRPPYERVMRLMAGAGDEAERQVAAAVGPEKARALRSTHGGWGPRFVMRGCGTPK